MQAADFTSDRAGRLVRTTQGNPAFVPHALPPALRLEGGLLLQLSDADRALGRLSGMARSMSNPRLLATPFLRREAVLSSRIEGTQASLRDLVVHEAPPEPVPGIGDLIEVTNYLRALDHALAPERTLPLSLRLVRELHGILMANARGGNLTPGEFRAMQNHVGEPGSTEATATYVPPPPPEMRAALDAFERYLHVDAAVPPLINIALLHYQFEAIHPFIDGNGRIGRLLITILMGAERLLDTPLLYLSAYFERNRAEYYDRLLAVSQKGDFEGWLGFFLRGVEQQSLDALTRAGRMQHVRMDYHKLLREANAPSSAYRVADLLVEKPAVTANTVVRRLGVTHRTATLTLTRLERLGIVKRPLANRRNRVYLATAIQAALDEQLT